VNDALKSLETEGILAKIEQVTHYASSALFYYPAELTQTQIGTIRKHVYSSARLIDRYSAPNVTKAVGVHLEGLVKAELRAQGFKIIDQNTASYKEKTWTRTGHNLDFVAEHLASGFPIGVEVKNTLGLIERAEVEVKLDICKYLAITPVFAVRWIGPHARLISDNAGFSWVFKTQIYPPGFEQLVKTIFRRFSLNYDVTRKNYKYQMPVSVRTDLPDGPIGKFTAWVQSQT
jgi:hypothetical protein